jgi:hypothetical protein
VTPVNPGSHCPRQMSASGRDGAQDEIPSWMEAKRGHLGTAVHMLRVKI